jgi:hypothetical protein
VALILGALGVVADLLRAQRLILQSAHERVRRVELALGIPPSGYVPAGPAEDRVGELRPVSSGS